MRVGLDVGSTTIKCVVLDDRNNLIYHTYERHYSHIVEKSAELLRRVAERCGREAVFAISGSAGMGMAESVKAPFVQEVFATRVAANRLAPGTDVIIELGGEDAKILFLTNGMEVRMNGSCAGGTGAFIDQMATLLKMGAEEMDKAAQTAERTYTIAARCGVFAKSDIQPLINQGAKSADIAKSIYQAVVNQTIAGLAQGRPINGHVLYLGGPLTFSKCLRQSFDETLGVTGTCPENSLLFVALGAAFYAEESWDLLKTAELLEQRGMSETYRSQPPLFENQAEYDAFKARHAKAAVPQADFPTDYAKPVHTGIDSGSTTVKAAVIMGTGWQPRADINGGLAMGHYGKGRLLLEQAKQDHDRCNDYENAAIVSFCATNVIERFDHLPENADEDAVPQLFPPQWLSAIELLRYPDRVDFRVDRRMVFQAIHQKLAQQVEEVQSDSIQINNERYRLTKNDVRSNLERCLDMVQDRFPHKKPSLQKMIRSIR